MSAVPTIAPSAIARISSALSCVTPVLASTGTSPALSFAARSSARSTWAAGLRPADQQRVRAEERRAAGALATVRPATERLNSGVMLVKIATSSAPMACR